MTKLVTVPIEGATNVTLYDEHYDVEDGKIEVPNSVAKRVQSDVELQHGAAHGKPWIVEDSPKGADTRADTPPSPAKDKDKESKKPE